MYNNNNARKQYLFTMRHVLSGYLVFPSNIYKLIVFDFILVIVPTS